MLKIPIKMKSLNLSLKRLLEEIEFLNKIKLLPIFIFLLIFLFCTDKNHNNIHIENNFIVREIGKYTFGYNSNGKIHKYVLIIKKTTDGNIIYAVNDKLNKKKIFDSGITNIMSANSNWCFFWEEKERKMWIYNGDLQIIGNWKMDSNKYRFEVSEEKIPQHLLNYIKG